MRKYFANKKVVALIVVLVILGLGFLFLNSGSTGLFQGKLDLSTLKKPGISTAKLLPNKTLTPVDKKLLAPTAKPKEDVAAQIKDLKRGRELPTANIKDFGFKQIKTVDHYINNYLRAFLSEQSSSESLVPTEEGLNRLGRALDNVPPVGGNAYIKVYSVFEACTSGDPDWCHSDTNEQMIYEKLNDTVAPVNGGDFRVCLEGTSAVSTTLQELSFGWNSNRLALANITVNGFATNGVPLNPNDYTALRLTPPVTLSAGSCIDVNIEIKGGRNNELSYISTNFIGVDSVENLPVEFDLYDGYGRTNIFNQENNLDFRRNNYSGEDHPVVREAGVGFGGYTICASRNNLGTIDSLAFLINRDDVSEQVIQIKQYYSNSFIPGSFRQERVEYNLSGVQSRLVVVPINQSLTYGGCVDIYFSSVGAPPLSVNRMQVSLVNVENLGTTSLVLGEGYEQAALGLPLDHDWFVLTEDEEATVVEIRWSEPSNASPETFTRNGSSQYCYFKNESVPADANSVCPILDLAVDSRGLSDGVTMKPGEFVMSIHSNMLVPFNLHLYLSEYIEILGEQTVLISPGDNLINWDLGPSVSRGIYGYHLTGFADLPNRMVETGSNFFDAGELVFTLDKLDNYTYENALELRGELINTEVWGYAVAGERDSGYGLNALPYTAGHLIVDEPKVQLASSYSGTRDISLAQVNSGDGILSLFDGWMNLLSGSVVVKRMVFTHNVDKDHVPGDTLELKIGTGAVVPTQWTQNRSVEFDFTGGYPKILTGYSRIELNLVNPNTELLNSRRTPVIFSLSEVEVISTEDIFRSIPFPVELVTGFEIDPNTAELLAVAFRTLSGPILFITE